MMKKVNNFSHIQIGNLQLGDGFPVRLQSMCNTGTSDIQATVAQTIRILEAGADMVRITVPSMLEVEALKKIKKELRAQGFLQPLIADVHFNPEVAIACAAIVEKVRINPGNFTDRKRFSSKRLSDSEYHASLEKMSERAKPLFETCKQHGTALRIGVNHGSLCDRIVDRYGNGSLAMAMSAMEWVEIGEAHQFYNMVFSMKSSNVLTMIEATLLFVQKMKEAGVSYPLHLGVTEAGEGLDGRVKSAVGIGGLLMQGAGNTIRVSLTEPPENEIPFAMALLTAVKQHSSADYRLEDNGTLKYFCSEKDKNVWIAGASSVSGYYYAQKKLKNIVITNSFFSENENKELEDAILQACRIKMSKTEIIACPTCGRTDYDIMNVLQQVKSNLGHYPGLKIGVMGCIVNGPGEMSDADYGIVGASNNKMVVYKGEKKMSALLSQKEALILLKKLIERDLNWAIC
jgi:(E)-4-hydroxy-3-methylbut-2-enyl-diphosphate synthase